MEGNKKKRKNNGLELDRRMISKLWLDDMSKKMSSIHDSQRVLGASTLRSLRQSYIRMCDKSFDRISVATIQWYGTTDETTRKSRRLKKHFWKLEPHLNSVRLDEHWGISEWECPEDVEGPVRRRDVLETRVWWTFVDRSRLQSPFLFSLRFVLSYRFPCWFSMILSPFFLPSFLWLFLSSLLRFFVSFTSYLYLFLLFLGLLGFPMQL